MPPVTCLYPPGALWPGKRYSCRAISAATPGMLILDMVAPVLRSTHGRGTPATPLTCGSAAPGPRSDARRDLPRTTGRPRSGRETGRQRLYCLAVRVAAEA